MPSLYPAAYAEFNRMLEELAPEVPDMKGTRKDFLTDMIAKNKQYGEAVFVSPKQLNWVRSLHEEYVGNTDAEGDSPEELGADPRDSDGW